MPTRDILKKSDDRWWTAKTGPLALGSLFILSMVNSFVAARWLVNLLYLYRPWLRFYFKGQLDKWHGIPNSDVYSLKALQNQNAIVTFSTLYWGFLILCTALSIWLVFRWYRHFHVVNHDEYGTASLATPREIKNTSTAIPDRIDSFNGIGGIPISHSLLLSPASILLWLKMNTRLPEKIISKFPDGNNPTGKYYIDQATVNSLVVGITRSGKGEMFVNPLSDIISRAQTKSSMVTNDPKGELFQMSYKTLRQRGYDVQVLNLLNMNKSMSYNPLTAVIDFAKRGDVQKTQQYINSVSTAIYKKSKVGQGNGNEEFWENSSISLLNALILSLIDLAKQNNDWSIVTLRNAVSMLNTMGSEKVFVDKNNNIIDEPDQNSFQKSKLSVYFENLKKIPGNFRDQAFQSFQQSNFAGEETAGNVYSSAIAGLSLYLQDDVARLTSKNSIDLTSLGFPRMIRIKVGGDGINNKYFNQQGIVSIQDKLGKVIETRTADVDGTGFLSFPIKKKCPNLFTIKVSFESDQNDEEVRNDFLIFNVYKRFKKRGVSNKYVLDKYTNEKVLKRVEAVLDVQKSHIDKNTIIDIDIRYSDKPIALFMVTPPHNPAYNTIVSFLVDQIFNLNYEMAVLSGRKCFNRITFILDEFGNLPAINEMGTKVSIGLGQNILFDLVIQNLEQLTSKYGKEEGASIQSNCANLVYILTTSNDTAKTISDMLGKRTVNTATNNGTWNNIDSGSTHNQRIGQELFTVDELERLKDEEMIVFRSTARRNKHGKRVSSKPIFNTGRMSMPYRYMFLNKAFDDSMTMADIPVETPHLKLKLSDIAVDYLNLLEQQYERIHENDGPDKQSYDDDDSSNLDDGSLNDVLFKSQELADNAFMFGMNTHFMTLLNQSKAVSNLDKAEIKQDILESEANFFNNIKHNSFAWLSEVLGIELAKKFKKDFEYQRKQDFNDINI